MTQEERLMILQMVAEKKITVAEGVELLKAVNPDGQATATDEVPGQGAAVGPGSGSTPGSSPRPNYGFTPGSNPGATPGPGFGSFIDDVIDRVSSAFSEVWGSRWEFPEQLTGEFTAGEIPIRVATGNGRVNIQGWDRPGYQADIVVKARGGNEEEARRRAQDAYTVRADATGFDLEARHQVLADVIVNVNLMLPRQLAYRLVTRTGNGHIEVNDLSLLDGQITTGNGRVECRGGHAETLRLQSGNGAVEVELDVADLEAGTGNGSLTIRPEGVRPKRMHLSTGNGSVRVDTSRLPADAGYQIDASTAMGGVDISLPDLTYEQDTRAAVHKHIVAHSTSYAQTGTAVAINARTGMGSITLF